MRALHAGIGLRGQRALQRRQLRRGRASGTPPRRRRARVAASGANRRRLPSAASTAPRTALLTRTGLSALAMTSAAGLPVAASTNAPSSRLDEQRLVGRAHEQAARLQAPTGSRRAADRRIAPAASTPWRIVSKLVEASAAQCLIGRLRRGRSAGASASSSDQQTGRQDASSARFHEGGRGWPGRNRPPPWQASAQAIRPSCRRLPALAGLDVERRRTTAARASRRSGPWCPRR